MSIDRQMPAEMGPTVLSHCDFGVEVLTLSGRCCHELDSPVYPRDLIRTREVTQKRSPSPFRIHQIYCWGQTSYVGDDVVCPGFDGFNGSPNSRPNFNDGGTDRSVTQTCRCFACPNLKRDRFPVSGFFAGAPR